MQTYKIKYVDVFTTEPFCGNSAGVILNADGIPEQTMFRIADEMNLTESTFVTLPDSPAALCKIRFLTPSIEYDLSGHAMIGSCFALAEEGRVLLEDGCTRVSIETKVGEVPIDFYFHRDGSHASHDDSIETVRLKGANCGQLEKIMMNHRIIGHKAVREPASAVSEALGISESDILSTGLPMEIVTTGLIQLLVPVKSSETILRMRPDICKLKMMNNRLGVQTVDIFTLDAVNSECVTYSRHFAPVTGIFEDPASGAGAAAITTYLARQGVISPGSFKMDQGNDPTTKSRVMVDLDDSNEEFDSVWVGGLAVTSIVRELQVDAESITIT